MGWSQRRKAGVAGLSVLVLAVGGGAVAFSAGPGSGTKVIGCYEKSTGDLRVVKRARQCRDDEKVLRWNKRGPRGHIGLPGVDGVDGTPGAPGADGTDGATILTGDGPPTDALGTDGDYYVDTETARLFGPKADGHWPAQGTSLRGNTGPSGPAGPTGSRRPRGTTRPRRSGRRPRNGRHWTARTARTGERSSAARPPPVQASAARATSSWDTANLLLYGPKTAGGWGTGTSIKGAKGNKGDKGDPGLRQRLLF